MDLVLPLVDDLLRRALTCGAQVLADVECHVLVRIEALRARRPDVAPLEPERREQAFRLFERMIVSLYDLVAQWADDGVVNTAPEATRKARKPKPDARR